MKYHYPNQTKTFELIKIENYNYIFKCGHKVTDNVFLDLINIKTGIPNWQIPKLNFKK